MLKTKEEENKILTGEMVDFDIRVTWLAISKMYSPLAEQHGISMTMGLVLLIINAIHGTRATKIAPLLGMEPRSLTRMLKKMEEDKLIERRDDPHDKRSVRIFFTEKGLEKQKIAINKTVEFNNFIRQRIPREKLSSFFETVSLIHKASNEFEF